MPRLDSMHMHMPIPIFPYFPGAVDTWERIPYTHNIVPHLTIITSTPPVPPFPSEDERAQTGYPLWTLQPAVPKTIPRPSHDPHP